MSAGYAEQWADAEALAKGDLGLEHASPQEALAKIKELRLPVREAIMLEQTLPNATGASSARLRGR